LLFGVKMKTHFLVLFLCVLLVGCGGGQVQFVDAADPALPTKLGIGDQDWTRIKQLASRQEGFVIKDAGKAAPNVIEVELKKPDDARNDQGGPTERYEKKDGGWVLQTDFQGYWAVGKGRP
jgi:hypothetical protein